MKLRQGRKVPRNLYVQLGDEPNSSNAPGGDIDVGRVDTAELAALICHSVNAYACGSSWGQQDLQDAVADLLQRGPR